MNTKLYKKLCILVEIRQTYLGLYGIYVLNEHGHKEITEHYTTEQQARYIRSKYYFKPYIEWKKKRPITYIIRFICKLAYAMERNLSDLKPHVF
jgi:hypothetical protein